MTYADIKYSKELKDLFPESEWWWVKYIDVINGVNTNIDWYVVNQGQFDMLNESEPCNFQYIPALTTDMLLERLKDFMDDFEQYSLTIDKFDVGYSCYYSSRYGIKYSFDGQLTFVDKSLPNALAKMLIYLRDNKLLEGG